MCQEKTPLPIEHMPFTWKLLVGSECVHLCKYCINNSETSMSQPYEKGPQILVMRTTKTKRTGQSLNAPLYNQITSYVNKTSFLMNWKISFTRWENCCFLRLTLPLHQGEKNGKQELRKGMGGSLEHCRNPSVLITLSLKLGTTKPKAHDGRFSRTSRFLDVRPLLLVPLQCTKAQA